MTTARFVGRRPLEGQGVLDGAWLADAAGLQDNLKRASFDQEENLTESAANDPMSRRRAHVAMASCKCTCLWGTFDVYMRQVTIPTYKKGTLHYEATSDRRYFFYGVNVK